MDHVLPTFLGVIVLSGAHLFAAGLRFLDTTPRSVWLSGSSGVSVAYVFVHLLPELAHAQPAVAASGVLQAFERHVYLLALAGLGLFYGLERFVREHQRRCKADTAESTASTGAFWLHIGCFAMYNLLFGYLLLQREVSDVRELLLYVIAIGLHFVVNDYGLRKDHRGSYDRVGRWVLAGALLAGWTLGLTVKVDEAGTMSLFALLAGGIVLNVLKEELPEERESRFGAFASGAAGYAALLLVAA